MYKPHMIPVEEALERILSTVHVLEPEVKPILDCPGQVLAADVTAAFDIPPHDNSAMDGFAVLAGDTSHASQKQPVYLDVIGEVAAGYTSSLILTSGKALRIMTGAPLPAGADAVVQFENTDETARKKDNRPLDKIGIIRARCTGTEHTLQGGRYTIRAGCAQKRLPSLPGRYRCIGLTGPGAGHGHPPPGHIGALHR